MITQENRMKLWKVIKRVAYLNHILPPEEVYDQFNMKTLELEPRYLIIEYYLLDSEFTFEAYPENEFKSQKESDRLAQMFEDFFQDMEKGWNTILLIDMKTFKPYYLSKEIKYLKKTIK
jgi:hypothetical protein